MKPPKIKDRWEDNSPIMQAKLIQYELIREDEDNS